VRVARPVRRAGRGNGPRDNLGTAPRSDPYMVTGADEQIGGDLGVATTPGTGSGIVCANLAGEVLDACTRLGRALARAYRGSTLPNGQPGGVAFSTAQR
jgi:hypothetical protein